MPSENSSEPPKPSVGKILLALLFLFIGVLGILLPIIPGIPFLVMGLLWLGIIEKKHVKWLYEKYERRRQKHFKEKKSE